MYLFRAVFYVVYYLAANSCCVFFFSSRRRHTRYIGDWSSDVCSSDLCRSSFGGQLLWCCRRGFRRTGEPAIGSLSGKKPYSKSRDPASRSYSTSDWEKNMSVRRSIRAWAFACVIACAVSGGAAGGGRASI